MKVKLLFVLVFFCGALTFAQKTVTGTVTSKSDGEPLPGVSVTIKGTTTGTETNFDGDYSIKIEEGKVLVFSYLGFKKVEKTVGSDSKIDVVLEEENSVLDEIVVVGYGTTSKRKVNGNIASVTSDQIKEVPVASFQNAMVGKLAGVQITQVNGKAESGIKFRVRGVATVNGSQEPLYVVDGIPITNLDNNINDSPINPLIGINTADIESIQVLKDASAAAIYGSRATNGVVLITTKSGKEGKTRISFNSSYGWSQATNKREWLNTEEYVELFVEANLNSGFTEQDAFTRLNFFTDNEADWRQGLVDIDWQDLALVDGFVEDVGLSVSGGNAKTKYFMSMGYNKNDAIIRGNKLERYNLRVNIDHEISDKLKVGTNVSISKSQISRLSNDNAFATPLQAVAQVPYSTAYLDDGITPNGGTLYYNFLFQEFNADHNVNIWRNFAKAYGELKFSDDLKFRSEIGYDITNQTEDRFFGSLTESASTNGFADAYSFVDERYVLNNFFTYDKMFMDDKLSANLIVGMSFEETISRVRFVEGQNFASDLLQTVDSAGEIVGGGSNFEKFNFLSYFSRASLNYDGKYLLDLSVRVDASSRFGANNRYGTFPAASAGWIVTEEDFFNDDSFIQYLKARVSWGVTGNARIGNFASRSSINGARTYNQEPGLQIGRIGDPNLSWEETTQTNFGIDLGFFDRRVNVTVDYYNKQTTDLLLNVPIPGTNGAPSILRNAGDMENRGLEFTLNTVNVQTNDFSWNTSFNIANNRNEVLRLGDDNADIIDGQNIARVGEEVSSFYLVEYAGVDPANGDALFFRNTLLPDGTRDRTTTNVFGEASRVISGNPFPDVTAGITNTFSYREFDFSFTFQGQWGASIYNNGGRFQSANGDFYDNQSRDQLNRWQQPGDITNVPQARFFGGNGTQTSTRYLQEADFIRLRNLTFGYTIPDSVTSKFNVDRLRVYFTGVNLLTFTNYDGWDPEATADFNANNALRAGIDFYSAPPAKTFTLGINVDF